MSFLATTYRETGRVADRFDAIRAYWMDRVEKHKVYTATYRELDCLSDRELADLAMNRSMIKQIALEAAYGK